MVRKDKTGVLMISLGTPEKLTYGSVRAYLKEFLSDSRVIEFPKILWWFILNGPILTFRPQKSLEAYKAVWNMDKDESPLRTFARSQAELMQETFGDDLEIEWAFRYGSPSLEDGLKALWEKGCGKIVLFSLYPQYSATTVATAHDKIFDIMKKMRWQPAVRTVAPFYDDTQYIEQLAQSVEADLAKLDWTPDKTLISFHSIPQAYADKGDPYPEQCHATSKALVRRLGLGPDKVQTVFQSRFGPTQWVGPQAIDVVPALAKSGVKKIAVLAPAFMADCIETLEEINMELREVFIEAGGEEFHYIPCLNDSQYGVEAMKAVIKRESAGWV